MNISVYAFCIFYGSQKIWSWRIVTAFCVHYSLLSILLLHHAESMAGVTWSTWSITESKNPLAHTTDNQLDKNDSEIMDYMDYFTKLLTEIRARFIRNFYLLVLKTQLEIFVF